MASSSPSRSTNTSASTAELHARLSNKRYDPDACRDAIRGVSVPKGLGHRLHQLCIVRGIRYHEGFAEELYGVLPLFTRALNARKIMSNVVPDGLDNAHHVPYCIWHPQLASEKTYHELAERYSHMRYSVGRACAVAGYTALFESLNLLPEVHIAEEAREAGQSAIYNSIMNQPARYNVMNDYDLSTKDDQTVKEPAHLNGDTAVCWMLDVKQEYSPSLDHLMFNITEDMSVDEFTSESDARRLLAGRQSLQLLLEPLPLDLPTVQKDLLIAMAAYYGDIDRYQRLRRVTWVYGEVACCVRGIYHNTLFAVWWSRQAGPLPEAIDMAITARFIMNNVLSRVPCRADLAPYLIWWPLTALPSTYRELARLQPDMLLQVTQACIFAGYKDVFDELMPQIPSNQIPVLQEEAKLQANPHFKEALQQRASVLGDVPERANDKYAWKAANSYGLGRSSNNVLKYLSCQSIDTSWDTPYNGRSCSATDVELWACLPEAWRLGADSKDSIIELDYVDWPPRANAV